MKYAILSDIHGKRKHLKQVLKAIKAHDVDHIFCLGDIWECKIGKSQVKDFLFAFADQIVDYDPKLAKRLSSVSCIVGNQEERIRHLLPKEETDEELRYFLTLPPVIELTHGRLEHGHLFVNDKNWAPYPKRLDKHLLFFGHSHYSSLYQLQWQNKQWQPKKVDIQFGVPIELDLVRYWGINVGAVVSEEPEWLLYEETSNTVTFFRETVSSPENDKPA
ncbi:metallophosphoesterase [Brevibacillus fluminis]|uniref:Metallophosphoesterase n=1 Tax=Brevibacillus fluminis TaxID=511487 RepID=A0A3M8DKZ6_9BACL|nr:metallophosphoesterase family protein [Brevibacillus fluminis]RNB87777.1 metallophosphoesterase [Brevibacillus fluminis]